LIVPKVTFAAQPPKNEPAVTADAFGVRARYPLVGAVGNPLFAKLVVGEMLPELGLSAVEAKKEYEALALLKFKSKRVVVAASTLIKEIESVAVATHRRCWRRGKNTVLSYTTRVLICQCDALH
jgi:hypothetical protein